MFSKNLELRKRGENVINQKKWSYEKKTHLVTVQLYWLANEDYHSGLFDNSIQFLLSTKIVITLFFDSTKSHQVFALLSLFQVNFCAFDD